MAQEIADSTLLDTWGSGGNIVEPDISKIIEGWQLGEQPPHEYMNWLQNTFGSKLNHILKKGVASWNNETQYLAGSSVQHNGNVWLCKSTNTNSEPTDANTNWKRIITVESLTTVLAGYVAMTGDQTIAGIKTFSSSPIVPTPTSGTQAANKNYVDSAATLNINALTNKTTPVNADELVIADSVTSFSLKKLTWSNLKATLKTYFDTLYNFYNPNPIIMTGVVSFNSVTNEVAGTNIGVGVEVGDVILFSGATNSKNNSEFTVEVITNANNIIVNQAHANKGTSKNVATQVGDTNVTVKLLAKWYNASAGLGQGWVSMIGARGYNTEYKNPTNREIEVSISLEYSNSPQARLVVDGITVGNQQLTSAADSSMVASVPKGGIVSLLTVIGTPSIVYWSEKR